MICEYGKLYCLPLFIFTQSSIPGLKPGIVYIGHNILFFLYTAGFFVLFCFLQCSVKDFCVLVNERCSFILYFFVISFPDFGIKVILAS